jgi:Domain of unknown function (DUF4129)
MTSSTPHVDVQVATTAPLDARSRWIKFLVILPILSLVEIIPLTFLSVLLAPYIAALLVPPTYQQFTHQAASEYTTGALFPLTAAMVFSIWYGLAVRAIEERIHQPRAAIRVRNLLWSIGWLGPITAITIFIPHLIVQQGREFTGAAIVSDFLLFTVIYILGQIQTMPVFNTLSLLSELTLRVFQCVLIIMCGIAIICAVVPDLHSMEDPIISLLPIILLAGIVITTLPRYLLYRTTNHAKNEAHSWLGRFSWIGLAAFLLIGGALLALSANVQKDIIPTQSDSGDIISNGSQVSPPPNIQHLSPEQSGISLLYTALTLVVIIISLIVFVIILLSIRSARYDSALPTTPRRAMRPIRQHRRRDASLPHVDSARALYRQLLQRTDEIGPPAARFPHETPGEYAQRLHNLMNTPDSPIRETSDTTPSDTLDDLTQAYIQERYEGIPIDTNWHTRLRQRMRSLLGSFITRPPTGTRRI